MKTSQFSIDRASSSPSMAGSWKRSSHRLVLGLMMVVVPTVLLVACLDLPVSGSVAGQVMEYPTSQWVVSTAVIPLAPESEAGSAQLVISDVVASCNGAATLASPGEKGHTLGLSLSPFDGGAVREGVYAVGATADYDKGAATFVYQRGGRVITSFALSGEIEVTAVSDGLIQGYFNLTFPDGALDGVFNGEVCGD